MPLRVNFFPLPLVCAEVEESDAKLLVGDPKLLGLSAGSALVPTSTKPST